MSAGTATANMRGGALAVLATALLAGALMTGHSAAAQAGARDEPDTEAPERRRGVDPSSVGLTDSALRAAVEAALDDGSPGSGVAEDLDMIQVEIHSGLPADELAALVADHGGIVDGDVPGVMVLARLPATELETLESNPAVDHLQRPGRVDIPLDAAPVTVAPEFGPRLGQHVAKSGATAWHDAGYTGFGVKIGIIDLFGPVYQQAMAAGEVPVPAGTFCRFNGSPCNLFSAGQDHGVAVAEVIADVAPGATVYLATAVSVADLQAVVEYFAANGVKIITRSLAAYYDGPGNGTGAVDTVVDNAVAMGMTWFNSAGNSAGRLSPGPGESAQMGGYWRGTWNDVDADGYIEFAPGDELMRFECTSFFLGLRWSDWGANRTDYDLVMFDENGMLVGVHGENDQGAGAPPLEWPGDDLVCQPGVRYYFAIYLYDAGNGTAGDTLEVMVNGGPLERSNNPYSATQPASDSASAGAISVGAVAGGPESTDPFGVNRAYYSSVGPTNDGRIKPDLSAATCLSSFVYSQPSTPCFDGTSAAAPAAAGAAALVLEAGLASSPQSLKSFMLGATVDRGAPGPDNEFGHGEVLLPAPQRFTPVAPLRVFDTRPGESPDAARAVLKQKVHGGYVLSVQVAGVPGVPENGVGAVSLNVTATNTDGAGFITVYPCGAVGEVSSVNYGAGQTVANAVIAPVSPTGTVCFFSSVAADVLADVNGWFPLGSSFHPVSPTRVFDTRPGESPSAVRLVAKQRVGDGYVLEVPVTNLTSIVPASGVSAVSLNVTVVGPAGDGFLTVYPCGALGEVSSLNYGAGQVVANAVIAPVSASGTICFFSHAPTDVIADINGWFASGGFTSVTPGRVFDTRPGEGGTALRQVAKAQIGGAQVLEVQVTDLPGGVVPAAGVGAVSLNVVATNTGGSGYITVFPCGTRREVSSVNYLGGRTVANAVIAPVSATGTVCFYSLAPADVIVDINGWFAAA